MFPSSPNGPRVVQVSVTLELDPALTPVVSTRPDGEIGREVIVGLGSPGAGFDRTPHNAGRRIALWSMTMWIWRLATSA